MAAAGEEGQELKPPARGEFLRTAIGIVADAALPFFFLLAWQFPEVLPSDVLQSLIVAMVGEFMVMFTVCFRSSRELRSLGDLLVLLAFGLLPLALLLTAGVAFVEQRYAMTLAAVLMIARLTGIVWDGPQRHDFPATPLQAVGAFCLWWACIFILDDLKTRGIEVTTDRAVGEFGFVGTLYFGAVLLIRSAKLTRASFARRRAAPTS